MTRDEMIGVIRSGQVVLHKGRLIASEADVPSDADLAHGDPAKIQAAREALQARKRALDLELAALDEPIAAGPEKPAGPENPEVTPDRPADLKAAGKGK